MTVVRLKGVRKTGGTELVKVNLDEVYKLIECLIDDGKHGTGIFMDSRAGLLVVANSFPSVLKALRKHTGNRFPVLTRYFFNLRVAVRRDDVVRLWDDGKKRDIIMLDTSDPLGWDRDSTVQVEEELEVVVEKLGGRKRLARLAKQRKGERPTHVAKSRA